MDEADVDQLYRDEPEGFVAARDALARRLRQEGDREGAARVKALRRPTRVAWALNQLRDDRPDELAELLAVGAELRAAQEAAMRGDEAAGLREATTRRRTLVRSLAKAAGRRLGGAQAGAGGIEATLDAAVLDPEVGELLAAGRLDREREVAGFGDLGMLADVVPLRPRPARTPEARAGKAAGKQERDDAAERRRADLRRAAEEAAAEARAAEEEAEAARARADEAAAAVEDAEAALAEAREAARRARSDVTAAERRARSADAARRRAEAAVEDASG